MTRNLFRPWVGPAFGKCRFCGDPVKRPGARLCSSCWWASRRASEADEKLPAGNGGRS